MALLPVAVHLKHVAVWLRSRWFMYPLTRVLVIALLLCGLAHAQTPEKTLENKPPDALHDLSSALESLSHRAGRAVVQVFSTGFTLSSEEESGNASLLTRQKSTGSG